MLDPPPFAEQPAATAAAVPAAAAKVADGALPDDAAGEAADKPEAGGPSDVAIKPLADAFLDRHIVCGVLKPIKSDSEIDVVKRAVEACRAADIVIIDWFLRPGDASIAKGVLVKVLGDDRDLNGRLRLVIVYTSAAPLEKRRDELREELAKAGFNATDLAADVGLQVENCRIRFVQKAFGSLGKKVEDLPELAITEFSRQAKGLLPGFALLGVAALREATHHLLTTFGSAFDPAFVGHRMVSDPEDAHGFAMGVLMLLQIKGILSVPDRLGSALKHEEIAAWFDDRFPEGQLADDFKALSVTRETLRSSVLAGKASDNKLHTALFLPAPAGTASSVEIAVRLTSPG